MKNGTSVSKTASILLFAALLFASLPVSGGTIETQGIYVKNRTLRVIRMELLVDGMKHTFKLLPEKRVYVFTRGPFLEEFMFWSDHFRGKVRNLSVGFFDDLPATDRLRQVRMAVSVSEGERSFLYIDPGNFEQGSLLEVPKSVKNVRLLKYGFD
jgi:hypothetical protein